MRTPGIVASAPAEGEQPFDARSDERRARRQLRDAQRLQRGAARRRRQEERRRFRQVLADTAKSWPTCTCPLTPDLEREQLHALGAGCTAGDGLRPGYVCPRLDAVRRRLAL